MKSIVKETLEGGKLFKKSDLFHESVKIPSFPKNEKHNTPDSWVKINYKTYPRLNRVILPKPVKNDKKLIDLLISRRSVRDFSGKSINLGELSSILFYSAGITYIENKNWDVALRAYPSAGARYPLEIYVLINNVKGIKEGIYHYNVKEHSLELLRKGDFISTIQNIASQDLLKKANIVMVISAVLDRTRIKYGDRGYRFPFIESGHMSQNFYLVSQALGLGCCTIGGFIDNEINDLLDFADTSEKTIYLTAIGTKI